jgi:hypothetical protein
VATATTQFIQGPAWSKPGLDVVAGRFPLRVETHVSRMVSRLLPGVITVTPHARYFGLHPLVYSEISKRDIDYRADGPEFIRRCEVVIGAVSSLHEHAAEYGEGHGEDYIRPHLERNGHLDLAEMSQPNKYSQTLWGFSNAYYGSQLLIGALKIETGEIPRPGERFPEAPLRVAMGDLFDLVDRSEISVDELRSHEHLCFCSAAPNADGELLRRTFVRPDELDGFEGSDAARRATSQLIAAIVDAGVEGSLHDAFVRGVAFGHFIHADPVASSLSISHAWRGTILRNYSVGAWRRLWSWLVGRLDEPMTAGDLAAEATSALPEQSVSDFMRDLPATEAGGELLPAEYEIRAAQFTPEPYTELLLLAIGARRSQELDGEVARAFLGLDEPLAPLWMKAQLDAAIASDRSVRDFASELVLRLVERAHRVASDKMRQLGDGRLWMPTRLREREGILYRTSAEGWTDVALRIDTYGRVLFESGVLGRDGQVWSVTDEGRSLLA